MRISFVGGGTDIPWFYEKHGGAVISTAIDKYVTVEVETGSDDAIYINECGLRQYTRSLDAIENPYIREAMRLTGVDSGVSITIKSDVEPGKGLGGSSALTVGLVHSLTMYRREVDTPELGDIPKEYVARKACEIEINRLGNPIGKQDQYIAAYGGFRRFDFERDGHVQTELIRPPRGLEESLMLFNTCMQRESNKILAEQARTADTETLLKMKLQVSLMYAKLQVGDVRGIGKLLHEAWKLKRSLALSITNDRLNKIYRLAIDVGAIGGKVLGAGGGGYVLFVVPSVERQIQVSNALKGLGTQVPFRFEAKGAQIIDA